LVVLIRLPYFFGFYLVALAFLVRLESHRPKEGAGKAIAFRVNPVKPIDFFAVGVG
jgi:hypothetical protein